MIDLQTVKKAFKSLKTILSPHYVVNIFLACVFYCVKSFSPVCDVLFDECTVELREWEWLTFLGCVIVLKNRKQAAFAQYVSMACLFGKVLNGFMFFRHNVAYGILYGVACLLHFIFLPEPAYEGPEYVTYFRGPHLEDELTRDKRVSWFIAFYAAWSPPCVTFASVFSEISAEYHLDNLKFGKIDVSRYPKMAENFQISTSTWSRQLPTVILFQDGKEKMRRPLVTPKGHTLKFALTKDNIIREFELTSLHGECKKNPLKSRKDKQKEEKQE